VSSQTTLPSRYRQYLSSMRRDATQVVKRAMLRFGLVPPPFHIQIDITDRCNFRCPTCSKWKAAPSRGELQLDDWNTILETIRDVPLLRKISVTGGEPFMRPDLLQFLELAKRQGLEITLITNGWSLDGEVLNQLESIGVDRLMVSLNSLRASIHDETRGKPGSHARVMRAIEAWRTQPRTIDLCLSTVVMEQNCGELTSLVRFVQDKGLTGIILQVLGAEEAHYPFVKERRMPASTPAWYAHNPRWVRSTDVLRQQIHALLRLQQGGSPLFNPPSQLSNFALYFEDPDAIRRLPCLGTLSRMYIDPFGDVRVCYGYPPVGNILQDEPRQIWRSEQARRIRRDSRRCTRLCRMLNNNL